MRSQRGSRNESYLPWLTCELICACHSVTVPDATMSCESYVELDDEVVYLKALGCFFDVIERKFTWTVEHILGTLRSSPQTQNPRTICCTCKTPSVIVYALGRWDLKLYSPWVTLRIVSRCCLLVIVVDSSGVDQVGSFKLSTNYFHQSWLDFAKRG